MSVIDAIYQGQRGILRVAEERYAPTYLSGYGRLEGHLHWNTVARLQSDRQVKVAEEKIPSIFSARTDRQTAGSGIGQLKGVLLGRAELHLPVIIGGGVTLKLLCHRKGQRPS